MQTCSETDGACQHVEGKLICLCSIPAFTMASPLHCVMSPCDSTTSASPTLYQRALAEGIWLRLLLLVL